MSDQIVFLCPHGAAKSVLAAAYCRQLAHQWGVPLHVISAGTEPDAEVAPAVVALLRTEGIDVADQRPRRVTPEELAAAGRIISLGCDLGDLARPGMVIERWDDVPSPSQNLRGLVIKYGSMLNSSSSRSGMRQSVRLTEPKERFDDNNG